MPPSVLLLFLAALSFQRVNAARIPRSEDESDPMQDLMSNARTQLQTVSDQWNNLLTSSNLEQMSPVLLNRTAELRTRLEALSADLKKQYEAHGSEMNEKMAAAVTDTMSQLNSTLTSLQSHDASTLVEGAEDLQQRFNQDLKSTANTVFAELDKLAKASSEGTTNAQAELSQLTRTAVSSAVDFFQQFQNQLNRQS